MRAAAVVFDLDGTLTDSIGDIVAATNHALLSRGFPQLLLPALRRHVGDGARHLLSGAAGIPLEDPEIDQLYQAFVGYYAAHAVVHTRLREGVPFALGALARLPLAVCTNKPRAATEKVLSALGIASSFALCVAGDDLPRRKPDPAPLYHIAGRLGLAPAALIMVGDADQDVLCARRAGAQSVLVRGGIQAEDRALRAQPDAVLDSLRELPDLVQRWNQATTA